MARELRPLTSQDVDGLPTMCRRCLFWEEGAPRPEASAYTPVTTDPATERKRAWVTAQVRTDGPPGHVVMIDDQVVAYSLVAPVTAMAARGPLWPVPTPDALLFATVWVHPTHREAGVGRLLVQAALKDALRRDVPALEAYGDRRWREGSCLLPATWLLHEGFEVHAEHPRTPLFRLDVRRTARWADSFEQAWEEVRGRLPRRVPVRTPAPDLLAESSRTSPTEQRRER